VLARDFGCAASCGGSPLDDAFLGSNLTTHPGAKAWPATSQGALPSQRDHRWPNRGVPLWCRTTPKPGRERQRPAPAGRPGLWRSCWPRPSVMSYTEATWPEDRATRGRDPSAEPGAKTGVGGRTPPLPISGIGPKAINPFPFYYPWSTGNSKACLRLPRAAETTIPRSPCVDGQCASNRSSINFYNMRQEA
jgi:hypothetical protein